MGDNPLETKATNVLAAAAGVPTPAPARSLWAVGWRFRKLALILGGAGLVAAGGGYGYKYFTTGPGKVSAHDDAPVAVARADEPKLGDDTTAPVVRPPEMPGKDDGLPSVADVKVPVAPVPDGDPAVIALPPLPVITVPAGDQKKPDEELPKDWFGLGTTTDRRRPAAGSADTFQAGEPLPVDPKRVDPTAVPVVMPGNTVDRKDTPTNTGGPVIPVRGVETPPAPKPDAPPVAVPSDIKVDVPIVAPPAGPMGAKKDDPAPTPMIPKLDIDIPPPPAAPPPGAVKDETTPMVTAPGITVPSPKPGVPDVVVSPMTDVKAPEAPTIRLPGTVTPEAPVKAPVMMDPPAIAPPAKKDSYDELWHDDKGEPFAAISREYFRDPKYAAALEAYNRNRRDKIIRVPPPWVLEERFPNLINKAPDRSDKAAGNGGLKFEPVAPLPPSERTAAPAAAVTSRSNDEYKVTSESGELIREVARKALGDAGAWKKLYELNPGIDPTLPIPAGTTLRLK